MSNPPAEPSTSGREPARVSNSAMPKTIAQRRILFAFPAFKSHMSFVPTPSVMKAFKKALIRRMAALRVKELREKDARWM